MHENRRERREKKNVFDEMKLIRTCRWIKNFMSREEEQHTFVWSFVDPSIYPKNKTWMNSLKFYFASWLSAADLKLFFLFRSCFFFWLTYKRTLWNCALRTGNHERISCQNFVTWGQQTFAMTSSKNFRHCSRILLNLHSRSTQTTMRLFAGS